MLDRINKEGLLDTLRVWDGFLKKKVHLIACGGTALTLLGIKPSTKDVDLMVPELKEYMYLTNVLKSVGYEQVTGNGWAKGGGFIFDLFRENRIHTTELLESPLKRGNHILVQEFSNIYLGILNFYDLIISKLFRGTSVDIDDCRMLIKEKRKDIDLSKLEERYLESSLYEIAEDRVNKNLEYFLRIVSEEK